MCKGFYPAGGGEVAEAIQTAISINSPECGGGTDFELVVVWRDQGPHSLDAD